MSQHEGTFERTAEAALTALGACPSDEAFDAWADPAGAAQALSGENSELRVTLLRAVWEPQAATGDAATKPADALWTRVHRGSSEIRLCPALITGAPEIETRRATRVVVETEPSPDNAGAALARVVILLDRNVDTAHSRLLVAESWAHTEDLAVSRVRGMAARLARALSVPASLPQTGAAAELADSIAPAPQMSARALARFTLRSEGKLLVLRDFASRGPREGAALHFAIGLGFAAPAAGAWLMFARSVRAAGVTASGSLAWLVGSVLLTLAAVAFLGVARFARAYTAGSAPLVAIGAGKITVAPWVSRGGAVMPEPEGRFGAAIDLAEVRGVSVQDRKGRHALEVATEHGPIDALITDDPTIARYLAVALDRAISDLRPQSAPTARQRARKRGTAVTK
jgi:hypothetical protein